MRLLDYLQFGGPGSGCHGDNCGRPKGPGVLPGKEKYRAGETWTVESRSAHAVALGKAWVDKIIAGDAKLPALISKAAAANTTRQKLELQAEKIGKKMSEHWNKSDEERRATQKEHEALGEKADKIFGKFSKAYDESKRANAEIADRIASKLNASTPIDPAQRIVQAWDTTHPGKERIKQDVAEFEKLVGGAPKNGVGISKDVAGLNDGERWVGFRKTEENISGAIGSDRSYYRDETKSVYLSDNVSSAIVWHELGHYVEMTTPGGTLAARSFLDARTKGKDQVSLRNPEGTNGYRADEHYKDGKFMEKYVGKIYPKATEITSMGLQFMKEDVAHFYRMDPEHFHFTLGMIRAARMGGYPWK